MTRGANNQQSTNRMPGALHAAPRARRAQLDKKEPHHKSPGRTNRPPVVKIGRGMTNHDIAFRINAQFDGIPFASPMTAQNFYEFIRYWRLSMARRILVVEDNDDWRALMSLFLTRLSYRVIQASDGVEAIEKASNDLPHLILMDLKLPKLNGLEATAQIKQNPVTMNIPVVLCTAFGPESYKNDPLVSYVAEVVQKPIKLNVFKGLVQKYLPLSIDAAASSPTAV
jgi:CheY-like chemotaxis protein